MVALVSACTLLVSTGLAFSADQVATQGGIQAQEQDEIYGSQLMTQQERDEHRARMRAARSIEEQEKIRMEHHELMKERAKVQGLALPESPPPRGGKQMRPGSKGMGPATP